MGAPTRPRWPGTLLYVPLLYGTGWLLARPLAWLLPQWRPDQVNLAGAVMSLLLLLGSLPWRLRRAWGCDRPWRASRAPRAGRSGSPSGEGTA